MGLSECQTKEKAKDREVISMEDLLQRDEETLLVDDFQTYSSEEKGDDKSKYPFWHKDLIPNYGEYVGPLLHVNGECHLNPRREEDSPHTFEMFQVPDNLFPPISRVS